MSNQEECRIRIDLKVDPQSLEWRVWQYLKEYHKTHASLMIMNLAVQMYGHHLAEGEREQEESQSKAFAFCLSMLPLGARSLLGLLSTVLSSGDSPRRGATPVVDLDFNEEDSF